MKLPTGNGHSTLLCVSVIYSYINVGRLVRLSRNCVVYVCWLYGASNFCDVRTKRSGNRVNTVVSVGVRLGNTRTCYSRLPYIRGNVRTRLRG